MQNQALVDNISESKKQLIDFKKGAEGRSMITIDKGQFRTKFVIHDIRFENIDDYDLLTKEVSSDYSLNSDPLNPNLAEKSIREIIA